MSRNIFLVIAVLILVALGIGVFIFLNKGTGEPTPPPPPIGVTPTPTPVTPTTPPPVPSGDVIVIGTDEGQVTMKNFAKEATRIDSRGDIYFSKDEKKYHLVHFAGEKSFMITVVGKPVPQVAKEAEQAFLSALGIGQADACKLEVYITVPAWVDENYSQNYGLSFCPNSSLPHL